MYLTLFFNLLKSQPHRMPGLPSSNLSLRTLTDESNLIGPEDIFNGKPFF